MLAFGNVITLSKAGNFYNEGLWGDCLPAVGLKMKFDTRICLKVSNDRGEFELDRARSKYNIAKYSFALGQETHNSSKILTLVRCASC